MEIFSTDTIPAPEKIPDPDLSWFLKKNRFQQRVKPIFFHNCIFFCMRKKKNIWNIPLLNIQNLYKFWSYIRRKRIRIQPPPHFWKNRVGIRGRKIHESNRISGPKVNTNPIWFNDTQYSNRLYYKIEINKNKQVVQRTRWTH